MRALGNPSAQQTKTCQMRSSPVGAVGSLVCLGCAESCLMWAQQPSSFTQRLSAPASLTSLMQPSMLQLISLRRLMMHMATAAGQVGTF